MPDNADPKRPSFDERLEAINQTLELVAAMQLDNEKRFEQRFAAIAPTLLVRIAELHDRRITNLEDRQQ
ncbi:MAG: hypothetical protein NTW28_16910 [Candidatus Solibacter sp.]|nr:hypothetical protein [Candidatus Solibacter sp.]